MKKLLAWESGFIVFSLLVYFAALFFGMTQSEACVAVVIAIFLTLLLFTTAFVVAFETPFDTTVATVACIAFVLAGIIAAGANIVMVVVVGIALAGIAAFLVKYELKLKYGRVFLSLLAEEATLYGIFQYGHQA